jgi:hypothetical protein
MQNIGFSNREMGVVVKTTRVIRYASKESVVYPGFLLLIK